LREMPFLRRNFVRHFDGCPGNGRGVHGQIDQIRDVIDAVNYNPARDRNRIYILDEVHMLSTGAFNALLKTLEEPPAHVVFIMATTEYHKIPATILSRCQQYAFKLIPYSLILQRLQHIAQAEKIEISTSALEQVTFASGGSMRDAMSALDQVIAFSGATVGDEDVIMLLGLVEPAVLEGSRAPSRATTPKRPSAWFRAWWKPGRTCRISGGACWPISAT